MVSGISWQSEFLPLAQRFAGRVAVVDRDGSVTYAELFARAAGIAQAVGAAGAVPCEPVGLLLPNGRDAVAASYGITLAGAAEARLNPALSPHDLSHCIETAGIRVVVTDAAHAELVRRLGSVPVEVEAAHPAELDRCSFQAVPAEGWGRIGFTSGTTGKPKAIVHSQLGRWTANVLLRASLPREPSQGDNVLLVTPFSHGAALLTYAFLDGGAAVTLLLGLDAGEALQTIERRAVNQLFAPPTVLAKLLMEAGERQYPGLECIFTGTSPLTAELYRRARRTFGPIIRVTYGKSEIWNPITVLAPQEAEAWYGDSGEPASTCVGWPASGVEIAIAEAGGIDAGAHVAAGRRIGVVLLRARHMSMGLIDGGRFTPDPQDAFHDTGDLGFVDGEGRLHLCGRVADVMKSGGYRILPEEVEAPLRAAVAPADVSIVSLPSSYWGEIVTAVLTGPEPPGLRAAIARLTSYKRPRLVAELDEIPRNAIGKVVRRRARELILERYALEDGPHPRLVRR